MRDHSAQEEARFKTSASVAPVGISRDPRCHSSPWVEVSTVRIVGQKSDTRQDIVTEYSVYYQVRHCYSLRKAIKMRLCLVFYHDFRDMPCFNETVKRLCRIFWRVQSPGKYESGVVALQSAEGDGDSLFEDKPTRIRPREALEASLIIATVHHTQRKGFTRRSVSLPKDLRESPRAVSRVPPHTPHAKAQGKSV